MHNTAEFLRDKCLHGDIFIINLDTFSLDALLNLYSFDFVCFPNKLY